MKAVVFHEFGGLDVLQGGGRRRPASRGPARCRSAISASALNHLDVDMREGISRFPSSCRTRSASRSSGGSQELGEGRRGLGGRRPRDAVLHGHLRRVPLLPHRPRDALPDARVHQLLHAAASGARRLSRRPAACASPTSSTTRRRRAPGRVRHLLAHALHARPAAGRRDGADQLGRQRHRLGRRAARAARRRDRDRQRVEPDESSTRRASSAWTTGSTTRDRGRRREVMRLTDGAASSSSSSTWAASSSRRASTRSAKDGRLVICGGHSGEVVPFDIIPFFRAQKSVIGSFVYTRAEVETCFELRAPADQAARPRDFPLERRRRGDGDDGAPRALRQDRPHPSLKEADETRRCRRRRHVHRPDLRRRRGRRDPRPQAADDARRPVAGTVQGIREIAGRPARARPRSTRCSTGRRSRRTS